MMDELDDIFNVSPVADTLTNTISISPLVSASFDCNSKSTSLAMPTLVRYTTEEFLSWLGDTNEATSTQPLMINNITDDGVNSEKSPPLASKNAIAEASSPFGLQPINQICPDQNSCKKNCIADSFIDEVFGEDVNGVQIKQPCFTVMQPSPLSTNISRNPHTIQQQIPSNIPKTDDFSCSSPFPTFPTYYLEKCATQQSFTEQQISQATGIVESTFPDVKRLRNILLSAGYPSTQN